MSSNAEDLCTQAALDHYRAVLRKHVGEAGPDRIENLVREAARRIAAYRREFPVLRDYVVECRRTRPIPDPADVSPEEQARFRILDRKMRDFAASPDAVVMWPSVLSCACILTAPLVGLAAARDVFDPDSVLLLTDEEIGTLPQGLGEPTADVLWWSRAWWSFDELPRFRDESHLEAGRPVTWLCSPFALVDRPDGGQALWTWGLDGVRFQGDVPAGGTYWRLSAGTWTGPLSSGEKSELWYWDGTDATFSRPAGSWMS